MSDATKKPMIVAIDDNVSDRRLLRAALERTGLVEVAIVSDGVAGLELVRAYRPAAVILDLNLTDLDGPEVLAILKADPQTRHIPVVILTGDPDRRAEALDAGATAFLVKPESIEVLAAEVLSACGLS